MDTTQVAKPAPPRTQPTTPTPPRTAASLLREVLERVRKHVDDPTFDKIITDVESAATDLGLGSESRRVLRRLRPQTEPLAEEAAPAPAETPTVTLRLPPPREAVEPPQPPKDAALTLIADTAKNYVNDHPELDAEIVGLLRELERFANIGLGLEPASSMGGLDDDEETAAAA